MVVCTGSADNEGDNGYIAQSTAVKDRRSVAFRLARLETMDGMCGMYG